MAYTPARIVLEELDRVGVEAAFDDRHADSIRATSLLKLYPTGPGQWRLVPDGRVGAIRVGDIDIEVRPKIGIARLLFLLGYANDPASGNAEADAHAADELWPAVAETLTRHTERALNRGLLPGYRTVQEPSAVIRGRMLVTEQINRRPGLITPVEVQYDELTVDTTEHRILRTALHHVADLPRLPTALLHRIHALDATLRGARLLRARSAIPGWRVDRRTAHYAPALRLADIVLRQQSFEYGPGPFVAASFVVSMSSLFEQFVTVALREALLPYQGTTTAQPPSHLDINRYVDIQPDIVHTRANGAVTVIDAKYAVGGGAGRNPDRYQMLAYCTALQATRGYLAYAKGGSPRHLTIRNTAIELIEYPLGLALDPARILQQFDALAHAIAGPGQ